MLPFRGASLTFRGQTQVRRPLVKLRGSGYADVQKLRIPKPLVFALVITNVYWILLDDFEVPPISGNLHVSPCGCSPWENSCVSLPNPVSKQKLWFMMTHKHQMLHKSKGCHVFFPVQNEVQGFKQDSNKYVPISRNTRLCQITGLSKHFQTQRPNPAIFPETAPSALGHAESWQLRAIGPIDGGFSGQVQGACAKLHSVLWQQNPQNHAMLLLGNEMIDVWACAAKPLFFMTQPFECWFYISHHISFWWRWGKPNATNL